MEDIWATMDKSKAPVELDADTRMVSAYLFNLRKSLMDSGFSKREAQKMVHQIYVQVMTIDLLGDMVHMDDEDDE